MIDSIFVIGKPGSGKSIMVWYITSLLLEYGYNVFHKSDRLGLEEDVLKDTAHTNFQQDGSKIGKHSKLIADGPPGHRKVHVLDGLILNRVHESYVLHIANHKVPGTINLIEYAIGPEIDFGGGKEPLTQTADNLAKNIIKYRIMDRIFIIDVESPFIIRAYREMVRPDAMAPETFRAYFPDGGEMTDSMVKKLGKHYHHFKNLEEDHDGYYSEAKYVFEYKILPNLIKK